MAEDILVPNIGDFKNVEIIEVIVNEGDEIKKGDPLITVESDKSSVEVPSTHSGKIQKLHIKIGDKVSEGSPIASLAVSEQKKGGGTSLESKKKKISELPSSENELKTLIVPDIAMSGKLFVSKINVTENIKVLKDQIILVIEDDESSIDIPSPLDGLVKEILVKKDDNLEIGQEICKIFTPSYKKKPPIDPVNTIIPAESNLQNNFESESVSNISSASPKIMKFARELGVKIENVTGSGRLGRVLEDDIKTHIRNNLDQKTASNFKNEHANKSSNYEGLPYEHSEFGEIDEQNIPRIKRLSGPHLVRAWSEIPHVTQHDEIDITEMEDFRKNLVNLNNREKISITPLAFMMKALANAMRKFPNFNSSLNGEKVIYKKYFHIGIAVDTPHGLMVPKIRDVNKKQLLELSQELRKISKQCKELKIDKREFFGGSMTISSLGGIGGSFFTPIINAPEVSIIGIGKSEIKQIFIGGEFKARMMMPISLSYDHRIVDGAEAAKFCQDLKISLGRNFALEI